jgi:hypothetical protein
VRGYPARVAMPFQLPPPDPNERSGHDGSLGAVPAPMAVFARGHGPGEPERVSDAVLRWRPGVLFVF